MVFHVQNVIDIDGVHEDKQEGGHPHSAQDNTKDVELEVVEDVVVVIVICAVDGIAEQTNTRENDEGGGDDLVSNHSYLMFLVPFPEFFLILFFKIGDEGIKEAGRHKDA